MANPKGLKRPPNGGRYDPTAIDATGRAVGDRLEPVSDGSGGFHARWVTPAAAGSSVDVRKNSGGSTFTRPRINFIEGSNVTLTVADDAGNQEVDVTIAASGGGGSAPAWVTNHPDTPPGSPNANDHEYQNGDTIGGTTLGSPGTAPTIIDNRLKITGNAPGVAASFVGVAYSAPSTPYVATAKIVLKNIPGTFQVAQLFLRRASTARHQSVCLFRNAADFSSYRVETAKYSALTTRDSNANTFAWDKAVAYLRVTNDGTTATYEVSEDGYSDNWWPLLSEALSTHFTGGNLPDTFGVGIDSFSSTARICYVEWLRVT